MKQIFIALLVLISATCYGQIITEGSGSTSNNRSISKLGFRIPQVNALPVKPDLNNYTGDSASGALTYCKCIADTSKKGLYFWRTDRWVRVDSTRGGGGAGSIEYVVGGAAINVDSAGRVYTVNADTSILVTHYHFDSTLLEIASDTQHIVGEWPILWRRSNDTLYNALDSTFKAITLTDGIKDGGYVSWTGTGLSYDRSPVVYVKNQVFYSLGATQFTLPDADPTYDRFDVPGVDTDPGHILIEGEAEAQPQIPQLPNPATQLTLNTAILVSAGDTIPAVNVDIIYDEDDVSEWTHTTNATVGFANTDNPRHLTIAADMSSYVSTRTITFTRSAAISRADYTLLKFYVDLKGNLANNANITVRFYNGSTAVTGAITMSAAHGFTKVDVGYQTITLPLSSLAFSSNTFDRVVFTFTGAGPGLYFDWVQLQGNIDPGGSNGTGTVTIVTATNTYGLNWVITNPTTTPNLRATIDTSLIVTKGFFYNSIYNTVDSLADAIANNYVSYGDTATMLAGYVPKTRILTINGVAYDLSADRTWFTARITQPNDTCFIFDRGDSTWEVCVSAGGTGVASFAPNGGGDSIILTLNDGTRYAVAMGGGGSGTVTSVAMTMPGVLFDASVSGSPVTSAGTLAPSLASQSAWQMFGRMAGTSGLPSFGQLKAEHFNTSYTNGFTLYTDGSGGLTWGASGAGGSGVTRVGTLDSLTKVARGGQVSGTSLILQTADNTYPGLVSTSTQTFAGEKTFNNFITITPAATGVKQYYYTAGAGLNIGMGLQPNEMQFFTTPSNRFTFNGGGDLNATGVNEWMRISSGGVSIGSGATASAYTLLDLTSTSKGLLLPRLTTGQRNTFMPAASIPAGEFVYDTDLGRPYISTGANWRGVILDNDNIVSILAAIGASPNANGMTLTGTTLNLQPASASFGGVITTGAQTIAGAKTLTSTLSLGNPTGAKLWWYDGGAGQHQGVGINANENQFFCPSSNRFTFNPGGGDLNATGVNEVMRVASGGVNIGTATVNVASAILQLVSTAKGAINAPVMTETQRNAIASPASGLRVFNSTTTQPNYRDASTWQAQVGMTFGTAAPATTPTAIGNFFFDSTNKKLYIAGGTASSADWEILN